MLAYSLLKAHAGIVLCGDYLSLRLLHETIHSVNEISPLVREKDGLFLGLAYDVRKAFEGQREIVEPPPFCPEVGTRYGVSILWPVILVQSRMLRQSLGFIPSTKAHQTMAYALEDVIECAIKDDFGDRADDVLAAWTRVDTAHPFVEENLDTRCAEFCSWTKAPRRRRTAALLESLSPMYASLYPLRQAQAENQDLIAPEKFETWRGKEWPDPKW